MIDAMSEKKWKSFHDMCDRCGASPVNVFTRAEADGWAGDDDLARCPECGLEGGISVYDEDAAGVNWNDYDKEESP